MRHLISLALTLAALLLALSPASATVYVKYDSPGPIFDGTSWETAFHKIQEGINKATTGEEVWVAKGVYAENISFKAGVSLYGGMAGIETNRSQGNWRLNKTVIQSGPSLSDIITVTAGSPSDTRIDGFIIRNGNYGIKCSNASPTIANCRIMSNSMHGIRCDSASPVIINNEIITNERGGIHVTLSSSPVITNNTIAANTGYAESNDSNSGGILSASSIPYTVSNNIIAFNCPGIQQARYSRPITLYNNCIYGNKVLDLQGFATNPIGTNGNISVDPLFASNQCGDYHIQPGSPCRDSGNDTYVQSIGKDIDGQLRLQGTHVDIGADESDGTEWSVNPVIIHVSTDGSDSNDGLTWATTKKTVQNAIDTIGDSGGEVWVKAGAYRERVTIPPFISLFGGFAGHEATLERDWVHNVSILDGELKGSVITAKTGNSPTFIEGFTVRNGLSGAIICSNGSPVIRNNIITGNRCKGIGCSFSQAVISDNVITGNAGSSSGGGISCIDSNVLIINNTIAGNSGVNRGGIYFYGSSPKIVNNIVAYNSSGICKNGVNGPDYLMNNCVYGNTSYDYSGFSTDPTGSNGNISQDPKIASMVYGDFHIQPDSPCRNAGSNSELITDSRDVDGSIRPIDAQVDMGADESDGTFWNIQPRIIRVSPDGNDANDGSSWSSAKLTIQSAIDAASPGGEAWVKAGLYNELIKLQPFVYLYGGFGGTETERSQRNWTQNRSIIDGQQKGPVVNAELSGYRMSTLDGFTVRRGTVGIKSEAAIVSNNLICNHTQGALYCGFATRASNNLISNSSGAVTCDTAEFVNNTICGNSSSYKGTVRCLNGTSPLIANNIITGNCSGVIREAGSAPVIYNNCVYGNSAFNYSGFTSDPTGSNGNISADPRLVSVSNGNLHIQPDSPCRNTGSNIYASSDLFDIDGEPRIVGEQVDIGADESNGSTWDLTPRVIHVNSNGSDTNDGLSWNTAKLTIQEAINAVAETGGEVWVEKGVYKEKITVPMFVYLYGGFNGTESLKEHRNPAANTTTLDGDKTGTVVTFDSTGYLLCGIDGFTIKNGSGYYGGICCRNSSPIISGNIVTDNYAIGAIYCNTSQAVIANNIITKNALVASGAVHCLSSFPTILNNTITKNTSRGIFLVMSSPSINNNIIAFNSDGIYRETQLPSTLPSLSHNCVYGNAGSNYIGLTAGTTDFSLDPGFAGRNSYDFHLLPGSPCVDAGDPIGAPDVDLDGNPRPKDGNSDGIARVDVGCYEAPNNYKSMPDAKALADGSPVGIACPVSTAVFDGRFYVENINRTMGIGVLGNCSSTGRTMTIEGTMDTEDGERVIRSTAVNEGASALVPSPLYMNPNAIGGGPIGLQNGVMDYRFVKINDQLERRLFSYGGANNIGLLMKTTGTVANIGEGSFYLAGCSFDDGDEAIKGIKVDWPFSEAVPAEGSFVEVTAISSCTMKNGILVRMLRPVSPQAVRVLDQQE